MESSAALPIKNSAGESSLLAMDGLRGMAVLLVLLSHMSHGGLQLPLLPDMKGAGKTGVALFFVLSSFLLYRQWLAKTNNLVLLPAEWAAYITRRTMRIYPAYVLLLTVLTGLGVAGLFDFSPRDFFYHLFLLDGKRHLWAIPVEFTFYLFLPIATFLLLATPISRYQRVLILVSSIMALIAFPTERQSHPSLEFTFIPYAELFFIGMLCAELEPRSMLPRISKIADAFGLFGILIVLVTIPEILELVLSRHVPYDELHHSLWIFCIAAMALIMGCLSGGPLTQWIFSRSPLRWVGRISFSAYLFHPLFLFVVKKAQLHTAIGGMVFMIGTLIAAWILFNSVEKRGIKMGDQLVRKIHQHSLKNLDAP